MTSSCCAQDGLSVHYNEATGTAWLGSVHEIVLSEINCQLLCSFHWFGKNCVWFLVGVYFVQQLTTKSTHKHTTGTSFAKGKDLFLQFCLVQFCAGKSLDKVPY